MFLLLPEGGDEKLVPTPEVFPPNAEVFAPNAVVFPPNPEVFPPNPEVFPPNPVVLPKRLGFPIIRFYLKIYTNKLKHFLKAWKLFWC